VEYNQALSERRVERSKRCASWSNSVFPLLTSRFRSSRKQQNLTDAQVNDAAERNPQKIGGVLNNMKTIILASNRRVNITLSNIAQALIVGGVALTIAGAHARQSKN
jgi:hypothetical protein